MTHRLIRLISWLVPPAVRPRWREEWLAEVAEVLRTRGRLAAARMLRGALADARTVRRLSAERGRFQRPHPLRGLREDVRYAIRSIAHSRVFAACVVASLGLGIAGMVTAFTFINGMLFRPLPGVSNQDALVQVNLTHRAGAGTVYDSTFEDYTALRDGMTTLSGLAALLRDEIAVMIDGRAESVRAATTTGNYFDVLGVKPAIGRLYDTAVDSGGGAADVVVIAHSLWLRKFDARPDVLGAFVRLGASGNARIIGVAPPGFAGGSRADVGMGGTGVELWLPIPLARQVFPPPSGAPRVVFSGTAPADTERLPAVRQETSFSYFIGRIRGGLTVQDVVAESRVVAPRIALARPSDRPGAAIRVRSVNENLRQQVPAIAIALAVPMLVLIIGCVNAANMLLARGAQRARETAVRLALGATRWRIFRPLLIESLLLATIAVAVSLPISRWAISFATAVLNIPMPVDGSVLLFAMGTACASAVAFSLAPSLRMSAARPGAALGSSRAGEGTGRSRARRVLVISQVALSAALLGVGGQLVTFLAPQAQSAGIPADSLLMVSFDLRQFRLPPAAVDAFYEDVLGRVAARPEADGVGLARGTAVWTFGRGLASGALSVRRPDAGPRDVHVTIGGYTRGDLFRALGLPVVKGRLFTPQDETSIPRVAVVNRALADLLFQGDAVGRALIVRPWAAAKAADTDVTIVGVVENTREPSYSRSPVPAVYVPSRLEPEPRLTLYARASSSTPALAARIRDAVTAVDNRVPVIEMRTLEEISDIRQFPERIIAQGVSLLGLIGLLLATGGVYGVMSYLVSLRTREIGVRLALGADARSVLRMTLAESFTLAVWGAAIGGVGAFIVSKIVVAHMYGVEGLHATTFAASFSLLAIAMVAASAVPARRAARVDPIEALRQE